MELIAVAKNTDYIEVHPGALEQHQALGWVMCVKRESAKAEKPSADAGSSAKAGESSGESADANGDGKVTAAELKAALTEAGVKFDARWNKDKLAALWAAFQRWGMTADEWNNLADEDKAARMANVGAD